MLPDKKDDFGFSGLNISLISINRVYVTPYTQSCRCMGVAPRVTLITIPAIDLHTRSKTTPYRSLRHADVNRLSTNTYDIELGQFIRSKA
jgi:hypothetical protein